MKKRKQKHRQEKTSGNYTGIYYQRRGTGWIEPDGSSNTDIVIQRGNELSAKNGDRVEFEVIGQRHKKGSYEGKVLSIFDAKNTFLAEQMLLPENRMLRSRFPSGCGSEIKRLSAKTKSEGYRDLREVFCITIDPDDAKDFDDAVSIEKHADGFKLGVYIADVTFYVPDNSIIDKEAYLRGTSTYFPWGVIPMLPPALSEDLCSLKPGEERRAAACIINIDKHGNVIGSDIFRCFIINKRRLTYKEAQEIMDCKRKATPELSETLADMMHLSGILKKKRLDEGSLEFDLPEVKIDFSNSKFPKAVIPYEKYGTNGMIEEFMLLANRVVAGRLTDMDKGAIYRIHGAPEDEAVRNLYAFVKAAGFKMPIFEGLNSFRNILEIVRGTSYEKSVHMMVLRAMPKAKYTTVNIGHFGLGFDLYTHFTSPIRRYPDLMVHRLLFQGNAKNVRQNRNQTELEKICEACSTAEEKSLKAERDATSLCSCTVLHGAIGEVFEGRVSGIIEAGIFVELGSLGVDGMVHVSRLGKDYFYFDPATMSMIGKSTGQRINIGNTMKVRIIEVSIALRRIDLAPLEQTA